MPQNNYNLTLEEASKRLNKSKKTIGRYVKRGLLSPIQDVSDKGTLIYRFSEEDLANFKGGQGRQDKTKPKGKTGQSETTQRVSNLHNAKTRQDTEKGSVDKSSTDKLLAILSSQLEAQNQQIAKQQETINQLTETVKQNSQTLQGYSIKLLQLTEGKTRQDIDGQSVVTEDTTKSVDRQDTPKQEDKPEKGKEDGTDKTAKTGQPKKRGFFSKLFGLGNN